MYDTLSGARTGAQLRNQGHWVHVAVVAEAHVRATNAAGAGGERILLTSGNFFHQDLRKLYIPFVSFRRKSDGYEKKVDSAAELEIPNVPRGEPGSTKGISILTTYKSRKAEELLGLTPATPLKDVVAESVKDFKARGYPGFTV